MEGCTCSTGFWLCGSGSPVASLFRSAPNFFKDSLATALDRVWALRSRFLRQRFEFLRVFAQRSWVFVDLNLSALHHVLHIPIQFLERPLRLLL